MAALGSVPLEVALTIGGKVTAVIGSIPITIRSGTSVVLDREALVQVIVDNIRPDLAALLRAAADEIEHPSEGDDREAA